MPGSMPTARPRRFQDPTAHDPGALPRTGALIAGVDRIAMCGRFATVSRHQHAAPAIVVGVDGPLRFVAERTHASRAVLITPGFTHAVDPGPGRVAMFVLPPHAITRANLDPVRDLPDPGRWIDLARAVARQEITDFAPIDDAYHAAWTRARTLRPVDARLRTAMDALAANIDENVSVAALAARARLSPSRLMALSREHLGTSLRAYRGWLRTFQVARDYARGLSLTDAALNAGFSSSAHLSAAARDHFGIRPSDILAPRNRFAIRDVTGGRGGKRRFTGRRGDGEVLGVVQSSAGQLKEESE